MQINTTTLALFPAFVLCGLGDTQHSLPLCYITQLLFKLHYHCLGWRLPFFFP